MTTAAVPALVSAEWLLASLGNPGLRVLDASWHLPAAGRDAGAEFALRHIPGAGFFDIDAIAAPAPALPRTVPDAATFAGHTQALGIAPGDHVVVYDSLGIYSAPRAWWMFRLYGHERVSVLDGGLPAWIGAGGATESGDAPPLPSPGPFAAVLDAGLLRLADEVAAHADRRDATIVDVRAPAAFAGTGEPRTGHIPGALNLPFDRLIDASGRMLAGEALALRMAEAGIPTEAPLVFSCGSGITACIGALAAHVAGRGRVSVYDGSWAEWSRRPDLPVAQGR